MTRDWNRLQETYINFRHVQWFGEWSYVRESITSSRCWQNAAAPQTKWTFLRQSPWSILSNPSSRGMWVAKYRHNLSPLLKWGWFSLFSRSHTSCGQFVHMKSKPYWVVATLQTSKGSRIDRQFLDLSNNSWDKGGNEACHIHITSQAWLL